MAAGPGRRSFLSGALAVATGSGMAALGVFRTARPALAAGPLGQFGYRYHRGDCPSYAAPANCEPGCGPSPVYLDSCEPTGYYRGWFKNRPNEGFRLRPGQCLSGFDAWQWRYSGRCGTCARVISFRCHDGYKRIGGGWFNAICRHVDECDGRNPDLPSTSKPIGRIDVFRRAGARSFRIQGWSIDADLPRLAVPIRIALDGRVIARLRANRRANLLPPLFWQFGRNHGFDHKIRNLPSGRHVLKVIAVSIGGRGGNVEMFKRTIVVPYRHPRDRPGGGRSRCRALVVRLGLKPQQRPHADAVGLAAPHLPGNRPGHVPRWARRPVPSPLPPPSGCSRASPNRCRPSPALWSSAWPSSLCSCDGAAFSTSRSRRTPDRFPRTCSPSTPAGPPSGSASNSGQVYGPTCPSALPYVPALGILLLRPPLVGALAVGLGFGLTRGVLPTIYEIRRRRSAG